MTRVGACRGPRARLLLAIVAAAGAIGGCDGDSLELSVDLRTDLVAGVEFATVRTEHAPAPLAEDAPAPDTIDFAPPLRIDLVSARRVADFAAVDAGPAVVRVTLLSAFGEPVARRSVNLVIERSRVITVEVTRDCRGVSCPGAGGDPLLTTCLRGMCIDPRCTRETPEQCPPPECDSDGACSTDVACTEGVCSDDGTCFAREDSSLCGAGEVCDVEEGCVPAVEPDAGTEPPDAASADSAPPPPVDAGPRETETACGDGADNDGDGATDCDDMDCAGRGCGANGRECRGGSCVCPGGSPPETTCGDGVDGDCDGDRDCADSDCAARLCGGTNDRCCARACVDIRTSRAHCGGCGLACASGYDCVIADGNPTCDCGGSNSECHGGVGWVCSTTYGVCGCETDSACADGQSCIVRTGPNYCTY